MSDVIDTLVGIAPGSTLDGLRRRREISREQIQRAYDALFAPSPAADPPATQRLAVAAFVADLSDHGGPTSEHYLSLLRPRDAGLADAVQGLADEARQHGPWGTYREPGLQRENELGSWLRLPAQIRLRLGGQLAAVIEHAHFIALHPRDARPEILARLVDAGWSRAAVVTWSQLISYVSFQVRVVEGLRVLADQGVK